MKRFIVLCISTVIIFSGCGVPKTIDGVEYKPVGIFSKIIPENFSKNLSNYSESIQYEICVGNLIWGIILVETIIAPIYFFGFSIFNPISKIK